MILNKLVLLCSTAVGCAQARQALTACVLLLFTSIHFSALPYAYIMCNGSENSLSQILMLLCLMLPEVKEERKRQNQSDKLLCCSSLIPPLNLLFAVVLTKYQLQH